MVLEVATIRVLPGHEGAFEDAFRAARHLPAEAGGRILRMTRGVESPGTFVLLIEWESVEAHEEKFRRSELFGRWRAHIGPHFAEPPHVEHYTDVAD